MRDHNIHFHEKLTKIILQLSLNIPITKAFDTNSVNDPYCCNINIRTNNADPDQGPSALCAILVAMVLHIKR